ncbi:MAG: ABC transporter permease, partial [Actinomycetes bacterium]
MPSDPQHFVADPSEVEFVEVDAVRVNDRPTNLWLDAWRDARRRPIFYISGAMIILVALVALFPTWFTSVAPDRCDLKYSLLGPSDGHLLGFTRQGCDIYSRIIFGTSTSLSVGLIVTVLTTLVGIFVGAIAGFYGKWLDALLSRAGDIFFSIPYILAAVVIMSVFSQYR